MTPIHVILEAVARAYRVPLRDLTGRGRTPAVSSARRIAMLEAQHAGHSIKAIADAFECDRGTVAVALKREAAMRRGIVMTAAEARRAAE